MGGVGMALDPIDLPPLPPLPISPAQRNQAPTKKAPSTPANIDALLKKYGG